MKIIDERLNLGASVIVLERSTSVPDLLDEAAFAELLGLYNQCQRERDVTSGKARRFTICPVSIAITVGLREENKCILVALGRKVPKKWLAAERAAELRREHAVDFNTLAVLEDSEDCDELAEIALDQELRDVFVEYVVDEGDDTRAKAYALKNPSTALVAEIEALTTRRTAELCRHRSGRAVRDETVASDISTLKRFLGWMRDHRDRSDDVDEAPALTMRTVIASPFMGKWCEEYINWLRARKVGWASIANYTNSLYSLLTFVATSDEFEHTYDAGLTSFDMLANMRRQAHGHASTDRMYRKRDVNWMVRYPVTPFPIPTAWRTWLSCNQQPPSDTLTT